MPVLQDVSYKNPRKYKSFSLGFPEIDSLGRGKYVVFFT